MPGHLSGHMQQVSACNERWLQFQVGAVRRYSAEGEVEGLLRQAFLATNCYNRHCCWRHCCWRAQGGWLWKVFEFDNCYNRRQGLMKT